MIDPVMGGNATPVSWRGTMIIQVLHCPNCQGTDIVRHGKTRQGKQRYRCREKGCAGRTFLLEYAYAGRCDPHSPSRGSEDRKSTRLNSSHGSISYAVFCLKKKKKTRESNT